MKNIGSVQQEVLDSLVGGLDLVLEWAESPLAFRRSHFGGRLSAAEWKEVCRTRRCREAFNRLQEKDWIKIKVEAETVIFRLQKDALCATVQERIRKTKKALPHKMVCLVAFDFPVAANDARTFWRRFLRGSGFVQKQLSVWVSDKDVANDVRLLVELLEVSRRVSVYQSREV